MAEVGLRESGDPSRAFHGKLPAPSWHPSRPSRDLFTTVPRPVHDRLGTVSRPPAHSFTPPELFRDRSAQISRAAC